MKKKVLIVSIFYYPDSRVGAKRFGNLVRFLEPDGVTVHVLTIPEDQIPIKDPSLLPAGRVHHASMWPVYPISKQSYVKRILARLWEKHFCMLDYFSGWIFPALIKAVLLIKKFDIDIIIATAPPFTAMLVGAIASKLTNKKLILDYRDPWTTHEREYPSPFGKLINVASEIFSVKRASSIVFCSKMMKEVFAKKFIQQGLANYHVLTNGFMKKKAKIVPLYHSKNKVTMLYAGSFYGGRSIGLVAEALSMLIRKKIIDENNFEFIIYGQIQPRDMEIITSQNLNNYIKALDPIPYDKVLQYMKGADILFLPSAEEVKYAIPYKFFDYLMVRRPILVVAPNNSAMADIVRCVPYARFCALDDPDTIENTLAEMIMQRDDDGESSNEGFTWPVIADRYLRLLDSLN